MLTFSAICDDYVKAHGLAKKEFSKDEDAKKYASEMPYDSKDYPVVYFKSDILARRLRRILYPR